MSNELNNFKTRIELVESLARKTVKSTALLDNIYLIVDWVDEGIHNGEVTPQMEERLVNVEQFLSEKVI